MRCRSCNIGQNDLYGEPTFIIDGLCIDCRNIINYEPRVKLIEVDVGSDYDNGEFNVSITYEIIGIDINSQIQQLEFVLQPTR